MELLGDTTPHERLGPFAVNGVLARGGMSIVFRGSHRETGQRAALKTVEFASETLLSSLRREIHALSRVRHPGVVRILDHGIERGVPWYAMELLQGVTLSELSNQLWGRAGAHDATLGSATETAQSADAQIDVSTIADSAIAGTPPPPRITTPSSHTTGTTRSRNESANTRTQPLTAAGGHLTRVLTLVHRICAPLAFLHGEGIVHRDLKPSNIIVTAGDRPVLVDFGLAWRTAAGRGRAAPDVMRDLAGTPEYMAPEQAQLGRVDPRADLYSLGCILFSLITGRPPFVASHGQRVLEQHISAPPTLPSQLVGGVPRELDALVLSLLAKQPHDRIGHAADVARRLLDLGVLPDGKIDRSDSRHAAPPPRSYVYDPDLAGRSHLFSVLRGHLDDARAGRGSVALITGRSGIGKTYLAVDVARRCSLGMRVVTCECAPLDPPLRPLRTMLTSIVDRCRALGARTTKEILAEHSGVLAALEPSICQLPHQSDLLEPVPLIGTAARDRLLAALRAVMSNFARLTPLVVIIDDVQWADELTLRFLRTLPPDWIAGQRISLWLTCRDDSESSGISPSLVAVNMSVASTHVATELSARPGIQCHVVGRLDNDTVRDLICDMLAVRTAPPELVRATAEQAGGNPFFVAEYLRAAVDGGHLRRVSPTEISVGTLPTLSSMQQLVVHRLNGISDAARKLIETAAVLGREVDLGILTAVVGDSVLDAALGETIARHLLEQPTPSLIRFTHDKLREVAYARIAANRRTVLHRGAAAAIEAREPSEDARRAHAMILAHHFDAGMQPRRACEQFEFAADRALDSAAFARALYCYESAVRQSARSTRLAEPHASDNSKRSARWELGMARANFGLGHLDEAQSHAESSLDSLGVGAPKSRRQWATRLVLESVHQAATLLGTRAHAQTPVDCDPSHLANAAAAAGLLSHRFFYNDDALALMTSSLMAVNLAERARLSIRVPRPYVQLGLASGLLGLHGVAVGYFSRAQQAAREQSDPAETGFVEMVEAVYMGSLGRWRDAGHLASSALDRFAVLHDPVLHEMALTTVGHIEYYRGRFATSYARYSDVLRSANARGNDQHATWGRFSMARSLLRMGRANEARPLLQQARATLDNRPEQQSEVICSGLLALASLRCGDESAAVAHARTTLDAIGSGRPIGFPAVDGYRGAGEVWLEVWRRTRERGQETREPRRAARLIGRKLRRFARIFPMAVPMATLHAGHVARNDGDTQRSTRLFRDSRRSAAMLAMPYDELSATTALATLTTPGTREHELLVSQATRIEALLGPTDQSARITTL